MNIKEIELNKPFVVEENGVFFIVEYIRTPLAWAYNKDEIKRKYKALIKQRKAREKYKEKIKLFIIRQDLEIKRLMGRLNVTEMGALMMLKQSTDGLEPKEILVLVDKLGGNDNDR